MDLYEALRGTGLPRDIIGIIDTFVRCNMVPHEIEFTGNTGWKYRSQHIVCSMGYTVVMSGIKETLTWINNNPNISGEGDLPHEFMKLITEIEYLVRGDLICEGSLLDGAQKAIDYEGLINNVVVTQKNGKQSDIYVKSTGNLFYLPSARVFASQYVDMGYFREKESKGNILATGEIWHKRLVQCENDMKKIDVDPDIANCREYKNFTIIQYTYEVEIIFANGERIRALEAAKFDDDSVVFKKDEKIFYKHVLCPAVEINWPKDVRISNIVAAYKNRIAYETIDGRSIHFGDIKWQ